MTQNREIINETVFANLLGENFIFDKLLQPQTYPTTIWVSADIISQLYFYRLRLVDNCGSNSQHLSVK